MSESIVLSCDIHFTLTPDFSFLACGVDRLLDHLKRKISNIRRKRTNDLPHPLYEPSQESVEARAKNRRHSGSLNPSSPIFFTQVSLEWLTTFMFELGVDCSSSLSFVNFFSPFSSLHTRCLMISPLHGDSGVSYYRSAGYHHQRV